MSESDPHDQNATADSSAAKAPAAPAKLPNERAERRARRWRFRYRGAFMPLIRLLEGMAALGALALFAGLVLAIRLQQGPLEVDWLTPVLVNSVNDWAKPIAVKIRGTALTWRLGDRFLGITASDVQLFDAAGQAVFTVPQLDLGVSLPALLIGRFEPIRVTLTNPRFKLVRAPDGSIAFMLDYGHLWQAEAGPAEGAAPPTASRQPLAEFLSALSGPPKPGQLLGSLSEFAIRHAQAEIDDQRTGLVSRLTESDLRFDRIADGLDITLSAGMTLAAVPMTLVAQAHYDAGTEQLKVAAVWDGVQPGVMSPALPEAWRVFAGLDLPLSVQLQAGFDVARNRLGPARFRLDGKAGQILDPRLANGRLGVHHLGLEIGYEPATGQATLTALALDLGGPILSLQGSLTGFAANLQPRTDQPLVLAADLTASHLAVDQIDALWPPGVAEHARAWVTTNVSGGAVDTLQARLGLHWAPGATAPDSVTLGGNMMASGVGVTFMRGLPRVEDIAASIDFNRDHLQFAVKSAKLKGLTVPRGTILIDGLAQGAEKLTLDIGLQGPVRDVCQVLDVPRLHLLKSAGLDPAGAGGSIEGLLHFKLPLKQDLSFDDVEMAAKATITDGALTHVVLGKDLTALDGALTLTNQSLVIDGKAALDGVPAEAKLIQRLSGHTGLMTELQARARVDSAQRQHLGFDPIPDLVQGPVTAYIHYTQPSADQAMVTLGLDLADADLTVGLAGWHKPPGPPGHADLTLHLQQGRLQTIDAIRVTAPALEFGGSLSLDGPQLTRLDASDLAIGDSRLTGHVDHAAGAPWHIALQASALNLAPLLTALEAPDPPPDGTDGPDLALVVRADHASLGPGRMVSDILFSGRVRHHRLDQASLKAAIDGGAGVLFGLEPVERGGAFSLMTDDVGALLRVGDISDSIEKGHLILKGTSVLLGDARRFSGQILVTNYRLKHAPFMARLLSLASLTAFSSLLAGEGLPFTELKSDLVLENHQLTLHHARTYGGALGLNAEGQLDFARGMLGLDGTLVPAYTLNSLLGKLPILGNLLIGGEGQGIFAANFRATGSLDDPEIHINPLSALAPGFLRQLFLFDIPG